MDPWRLHETHSSPYLRNIALGKQCFFADLNTKDPEGHLDTFAVSAAFSEGFLCSLSYVQESERWPNHDLLSLDCELIALPHILTDGCFLSHLQMIRRTIAPDCNDPSLWHSLLTHQAWFSQREEKRLSDPTVSQNIKLKF